MYLRKEILGTPTYLGPSTSGLQITLSGVGTPIFPFCPRSARAPPEALSPVTTRLVVVDGEYHSATFGAKSSAFHGSLPGLVGEYLHFTGTMV